VRAPVRVHLAQCRSGGFSAAGGLATTFQVIERRRSRNKGTHCDRTLRWLPNRSEPQPIKPIAILVAGGGRVGTPARTAIVRIHFTRGRTGWDGGGSDLVPALLQKVSFRPKALYVTLKPLLFKHLGFKHPADGRRNPTYVLLPYPSGANGQRRAVPEA